MIIKFNGKREKKSAYKNEPLIECVYNKATNLIFRGQSTQRELNCIIVLTTKVTLGIKKKQFGLYLALVSTHFFWYSIG